MKKNSLLKDILDVLVASGAIIFVSLELFIFPCKVEGVSMYPTLKQDQKGYSFVCTKILGINRFDICVLKVNDNGEDKKIVKRVIGLPNETVEYKDNKLYINGEYYEESFLSDTYTQDLKVVLGEDEYFCLGDNRAVSRDSRYYGAFSYSDFKATHMLVVSPFSEKGFRK